MKQHLWRTVSLGVPDRGHAGPLCKVGLAQGRAGEVVRWTDGQRQKLFFSTLFDTNDS